MAPTLTPHGTYKTNDPAPKMDWELADLADYRQHLQRFQVRKDPHGGIQDAVFITWYAKLDASHAVILMSSCKEGPFRLLLDLQLMPIELQGDGLESRKAVQVKGVDGHELIKERLHSQGYAQALYKVVAEALEVLVVSDEEQYPPGVGLWRSLARDGDKGSATVVVYDFGKQAILRFCEQQGFQYETGKPVEYDGDNIPEEHIWGYDKAETRLVADMQVTNSK